MCVKGQETLVFSMGLIGLQTNGETLIAQGMGASWTGAVVQQGTTTKQRVIVGTVSSLPELVAAANLVAPTLTIIGKVVGLRNQLNWVKPQVCHHPMMY